MGRRCVCPALKRWNRKGNSPPSAGTACLPVGRGPGGRDFKRGLNRFLLYVTIWTRSYTKEIYSVKRFLQVLFLITILLISAGKVLDAQNGLRIETLPGIVKQGEVCLIKVSGPDSLKSIDGEFRGERFPIALGEQNGIYEGLIGIDMSTPPATYEIKVTARDGDGQLYSGYLSLKVEKVDFGTEELSLPSSLVDLDEKTLERVRKEAKQLQTLFQGFREERLWRGAFIRPVEGDLSGTFGSSRIINGKQRSPHTGVDLRGEEGTPVLASNSGIVVLVDELFFNGKSVILDHGWGLYSMYFHLSEVQVKKGDRVGTGTTLGRVGSTGRSTGPHLHWGVKLNGARVDPLSLLRLGM
jgi:murein DD-endopeptidase MepM/ murein hydrolase activator NlpD